MVKFYGVLSYVWLNPDNIILNNLKKGEIDGVLISSIGYSKYATYRKWIRRNKNIIPSIMIDHEAFYRNKTGKKWSYNAIKQLQIYSAYNLKNLGFKEIIVIAPDEIGEEETSYNWGIKFIKDYEGEILFPFHGKLPADAEYVGIPKERLGTEWYKLLNNKYKLHGLGVSPKNMKMLHDYNFFSCDGTIDSDGWSNNRVEDFKLSIDKQTKRTGE